MTFCIFTVVATKINDSLFTNATASADTSFQHLPTTGLDQIQIGQSEQVVSESEAGELSRRIDELRALALDINEEVRLQDEKLGELIPSVDKANERLSNLTKKSDKLT